MPRKIVRTAMLLVLSFLAASPALLRSAEPKEKREKAAPLKVGAEAPDFELAGLDGENVKLSKLVESGPVVVVVLRGYPGYQCPLCTQQALEFTAREKKFRAAGAQVVMIYPGPADRLKEHAAEFVKGKNLPESFHLVLDPDYSFTEAWHLRWNAPGETAFPSTFVLDKERKVRFAKVSRSHGDRAPAADVLKALAAP